MVKSASTVLIKWFRTITKSIKTITGNWASLECVSLDDQDLIKVNSFLLCSEIMLPDGATLLSSKLLLCVNR